MKEKSDEEITEFINQHKLEKVSVSDIRQADAGKFDSSDFNLYEDKPVPSMPQAQGETEKQEEAKAE